MYSETEDVIRALAQNAEGVCRAYLPAGRREGSYWIVGDLQNNPGRSLFVRLTGPASGPGAAGKFSDSATGEHGDLLDLHDRIRYSLKVSAAFQRSYKGVAVKAELIKETVYRYPVCKGAVITQFELIISIRKCKTFDELCFSVYFSQSTALIINHSRDHLKGQGAVTIYMKP